MVVIFSQANIIFSTNVETETWKENFKARETESKREEKDSRKSPLRDCMGWMCYLCGDAVDVLLLDPQHFYTPFIYLASVAQRHGNLITALPHSLVSAFTEQIH